MTLVLSSFAASAQTAIDAAAPAAYPSAPVKIVVGFPPGTAPDTLARLVADGLAASLGKPVIVVNVAGAAGNIAADRVAKAKPDGYTLLLAGNASLVVNESLYEKVPFDSKKDFAPISQVAITPNVLVVHPSVRAKSVKELVALAKTEPDKLSYAHVGPGTSQHLAAELFKSQAGVSLLGVAYRGGNTSIPDLLAGRVQVCFCNVATTMPLVRDGKLRALAVTSSARSPIAPDVPTMQEESFPEFSADAWFGLVAPAGTPESSVSRIQSEVSKLLKEPALSKAMTELGMVPIGNSANDLAQIIERESTYWASAIKQMGIKVQ